MQSFSVPNTDYCANPESTGIDPTAFDNYFSENYQKQIICAAHPYCKGHTPLLGVSSHRCIGCGLTIHCKMFCGEFWKEVDIFHSDLTQYGSTCLQSGQCTPTDNSVLCYWCINFATQQQKTPAIPVAANPASSLKDLPVPTVNVTLNEIMERGICIDDDLWFDLIQDEGFTLAEIEMRKKQRKRKEDPDNSGEQSNNTGVGGNVKKGKKPTLASTFLQNQDCIPSYTVSQCRF